MYITDISKEALLHIWSISVSRARLTIRGPHTNVRRGPFSHTCSQDFLWGCTFFAPNSWRPFLVVVTFKPQNFWFLNVRQTSQQRGKNLAVDREALWRRGPPPMVQPAQWLIRPCLSPYPISPAMVWSMATSRVELAQSPTLGYTWWIAEWYGQQPRHFHFAGWRLNLTFAVSEWVKSQDSV